MASDEICFKVLPLDKYEHAALKALYEGVADPGQQRTALNVIVNKLCRTHDVLYVPGSFDQSAFMNGRAYVGMRIMQLLKLPVGKLEVNEDG